MNNQVELNVWTHPKTSEVRVYVNGLAAIGASGDKIWLTEHSNELNDTYEAHMKLGWGGSMNQYRNLGIKNKIDAPYQILDMCEELNLEGKTWAEILEMAA